MAACARAAQEVALRHRERPLRLLRADLDCLAAGDRSAARGARAEGGRAGRSPPQRPASQSVLASLAPPVVVGAGARPRGRIDDVHGALRPGDEEAGASVAKKSEAERREDFARSTFDLEKRWRDEGGAGAPGLFWDAGSGFFCFGDGGFAL